MAIQIEMPNGMNQADWDDLQKGKAMTGNVWNERVGEAIREARLKAVWRKTHRDYKGKLPDGTRTIMVLRNGGSCLVALENLTDEEINSRI